MPLLIATCRRRVGKEGASSRSRARGLTPTDARFKLIPCGLIKSGLRLVRAEIDPSSSY